jgi:hypothetical protein
VEAHVARPGRRTPRGGGSHREHVPGLGVTGDPAFFDAPDRAKLLADRVALDVAPLGVRVGGGTGHLRTSPIRRHLRDAEAGQLMARSTEVISGVVGRDVLGVSSWNVAR